MHYGYLGYLLFMLPALLLGLYAQIMVKVNYSRYSKVISRSGLTGREAAERVLQMNGVGGVRIGRVGGTLTDHYDPRSNSINLSQGVYDSATVAAIGVAAHEAGHAVQYAKNYAPIKLRMAIIPVCNIGTRLGPLLIILGFFLSYMAESMITVGNTLYFIGLILFCTVALFQLVTLPVELDASRRALKALSGGVMEKSELPGVRKVLTAAALTYVAALVSAVIALFIAQCTSVSAMPCTACTAMSWTLLP